MVDLQRRSSETSAAQSCVAKSPLQIQQVLATWEPTTPISYDSVHISPAIAQHFLFGSPWADEFALWLQELKWDSEGRGPMDRDIDAVVRAWVEFLCFFGVTIVLGHKSHSSGIRPRPWFPCGEDVVKISAALSHGRSSYQCDISPTWISRSIHRPKQSFQEAKKLKFGQAAARRLRRAVGVF